MGRKSTYTDDKDKEIVERLSEGEPLAQICRDEHMPGLSTVYDWMEANAEFSGRIARARIAGYDIIAQDAMRIADTPVEGKRVKVTDGRVEEWTEDMLGHRKLQVETRLKLLAKWDPKRYGERVAMEHTGAGGGPIATLDASKLSDAALKELLNARQTESG